MDLKIFGDIDKNKGGKIASEMPAWYMETHVEELREEIGRLMRSIERGQVPADSIPEAKAEVERLQTKMRYITESKPHVSDQEKNLLWKAYKDLSVLISDTLFTYDEMQRGTASAHEEARRMTEPIIKLEEDLVDLAKSCNVQVHNKCMVNRDGATKMFKLAGKLIGEPTNVENLRLVSRRAKDEVEVKTTRRKVA